MDEPLVKSIEDFGRRMRGLARGLWGGTIDYATWAYSTAAAIYRGYEQAWQEGEKQCGIGPGERTSHEFYILNQAISDDVGRVLALGDFIETHAQRDGFLYETTVNRVELWVNRYSSIVALAQATACADKKFKWRLGSTQEHCGDCSKYAGKVYRASSWLEADAMPQSHSLECGGWRCECRLEQTEDRITPGRIGRPSGGG